MYEPTHRDSPSIGAAQLFAGLSSADKTATLTEANRGSQIGRRSESNALIGRRAGHAGTVFW